MANSDISWPGLSPLPINLWPLARGFERAARRHPTLILRRLQLMQHLHLMQRLLTTGEEGADGGEGHGGEEI
jgi:hypothetical protein